MAYEEKVLITGQADMSAVVKAINELEDKVLTIKFDADSQSLFKDIQGDIRKIQSAINNIDFSGLGKNLAQELQKGTKKASLSVDDYVSSMRKSLKVLQSKYGKLFDPSDKGLDAVSNIEELTSWKDNLKYLANIADDSGKSVKDFEKSWNLMKKGQNLQPLEQVESSAENIKSTLQSLGNLKLDADIKAQIDSLVASMTELVATAKEMNKVLSSISSSTIQSPGIYEEQIRQTTSQIEDVSARIEQANQKIREAFGDREQIYKIAEDMEKAANEKGSYMKSAMRFTSNHFGEDLSRKEDKTKYQHGLQYLEEYLYLGGQVEKLNIKGLTDESEVVSQVKATLAARTQELHILEQQNIALVSKKQTQENLLKQAKAAAPNKASDEDIQKIKQEVLQERSRRKQEEESQKNIQRQMNEVEKINQQFENNMLHKRLKAMESDVSAWESTGRSFNIEPIKTSYEDLEKYLNAYKEYKKELQKWDAGGKQGDMPEFDTSQILDEFERLDQGIKKVSNRMTGLQKEFGGVISASKALSASNRMLKWLENNDRATKEYGDQIKDLADQMNNVRTQKPYEQIQGKFNGIVSEATNKGLLGRSWLSSIKKTFGHITEIFGSYSVVNDVEEAAREMVQNVKVVDDAMTNLRMATGVTKSDAADLMDTYSEMGTELKTLGTDVATASTEFMKQGESIESANKLAQDSIVLSKIGDLSAEDSTKYLTAALKGYKMEATEAMDVVDKISTVDLMSATDVGGLAEGMSKVAGSANLAGLEMDTLLGYLAAIGEVTQQDMSSVGTAFNTILARMGNIKLGRLDDYKAETGEDLSNVETVLKGEGINLRDEAGQFRDFGDVLDETAARWQSFSKVSQSAIAQAFAGKHDVCLNIQQCIGTA